jgi:hypothetical protein
MLRGLVAGDGRCLGIGSARGHVRLCVDTQCVLSVGRKAYDRPSGSRVLYM